MRPISERAASYLWRKYADYLWTKWERMLIWNMVEPYTRPKSFTPVVTTYIAAFYTGVVGAAITEQLYKVFLLFSVLGFAVMNILLGSVSLLFNIRFRDNYLGCSSGEHHLIAC